MLVLQANLRFVHIRVVGMHGMGMRMQIQQKGIRYHGPAEKQEQEQGDIFQEGLHLLYRNLSKCTINSTMLHLYKADAAFSTLLLLQIPPECSLMQIFQDQSCQFIYAFLTTCHKSSAAAALEQDLKAIGKSPCRLKRIFKKHI